MAGLARQWSHTCDLTAGEITWEKRGERRSSSPGAGCVPIYQFLQSQFLTEVNFVLQVPLFSTGVTGVEFSSVKRKTLSVNYE